MIDLENYVTTDIIKSGFTKQHRFNHINCKAGEDTRQRLYIKRVSEGIIGYCHNCGESGFFRISDDKFRVARGGNASTRATIDLVTSNEKDAAVPEDVESRFEKFNLDQIAWLYSYGLTGEDCIKYKIFKRKNSLLFHIKEGFIQYRHFARSGSKYTSVLTDGVKKYLYLEGKNSVNGPLVVVEDYISGIRLHKLGFNVLVLFGTHLCMPMSYLMLIVGENKKRDFFVWLDGDVAGASATKPLADVIGHLANVHQIHRWRTQPKDLNDSEIKSVLHSALFVGASAASASATSWKFEDFIQGK